MFRTRLKIVLNTTELSYYVWLCIISVPVLYNLLLIVARCVFIELQIEYRTLWLGLDYASDFFYLIDMVIKFRTGNYDFTLY